jgi:hypothetical protein
MNLSQLTGILRIVAPLLVNVAGYYFGADTVNLVGTTLATVVAAGGWSAYANSTSSQVKTVAAQPGVQVAVTPAAAPALQTLARDPTVPDVVPISLPLPH